MPFPRRPDLFPKLPDMPGELRGLVAQIPQGRVATCGQLAIALGDRRGARWVGHWLFRHRHGEDCPCHRIVYAGGVLQGFAEQSPEEQAERLASEGVTVVRGRVDMDKVAEIPFASSAPLAALHTFQELTAKHAEITRPRGRPRLIAGVDLSYGKKSEDDAEGEVWAIAALVLVDAKTGETIATHTVRHQVTFPYITSYLSFRELPAMLAVIEAAERAGNRPETILVDGAGVLHPRRAGIAAMLGVVSGYSTIGIAKSHLCGTYDESLLAKQRRAPVEWNGEIAGLAMLTRQSSPKPVYVSPGHGHSVGSAVVVVRDLLSNGYLPTPVAAADRISRRLAREEAK